MKQPLIAYQTTELLDTPRTVRLLQQWRKREPKLRKLFQHAEERGYKAATGPKNVLGFREKYRLQKPVKDPRSTQTVKEASFELTVQNLTKSGSKDQLAIVTVEMKAGKNSERYECLLEAPGGNFNKVREFMVDKNKVVRARSWWSRTKRCLRKRCSYTCGAAIPG